MEPKNIGKRTGLSATSASSVTSVTTQRKYWHFVEKFSDVFIPKTVGISDEYPWVNSENDDYVMDVIRDEYLADSTVTLVFVGKCTWSRKFVDWEVYSSLRRDRNNRLNGLLAIQLPSAAKENPKLPAPISKNVIRDSSGADIGYAISPTRRPPQDYKQRLTTRSRQGHAEQS